jgi:L-ascorbate metabolism protein UlaG (beta-lactamase superfamily)
MHFQHIRHATHRLTYAGKTLLIDPVFSPRGTIKRIPGAPNKSCNPLSELPVPAEALCDYDFLLISHLHKDHLDEAAEALLPKERPVVCAAVFEDALRRKGFKDTYPLTDTLTLGDITITLTGGTHGTGISALALNPVHGFILKAAGEPTVFITGDTVWCPAVEAALLTHQPQLIICYGGAARFAGEPITMGLTDFTKLRSACPNSQLAIIHTEGWNHCGLSREAVRTWAAQEKQTLCVWVPEDGDQASF